MIRKLGMEKKRSYWQQFPTLVRSPEMKASALHQLLGNRTGVKQFHSCKKKTNHCRSVFSSLSRKFKEKCLSQGCSKGTVTPSDAETEIWLLHERFALLGGGEQERKGADNSVPLAHLSCC